MYDRDYYQANREHINQQHRENYAKHRDEHNAKIKRFLLKMDAAFRAEARGDAIVVRRKPFVLLSTSRMAPKTILRDARKSL